MTKIKELCPTEAQDQIKLAVWLGKQRIKFTASANGGARNYFEAAKFKRMGVSAGFPDIFIPIPSAPYHGLFIELKRKIGGVISETQKEWLKHLQEKGYYAEVAYGFEHAKEIVNNYLLLTPSAA